MGRPDPVIEKESPEAQKDSVCKNFHCSVASGSICPFQTCNIPLSKKKNHAIYQREVLDVAKSYDACDYFFLVCFYFLSSTQNIRTKRLVYEIL